MIITKEETQIRSIAKTFVYRIINTLATMIMTLIVFDATTAIAGAMAMVQIILGSSIYFVYDRAWLFSKWYRLQGFDTKVRSLLKTIGYRAIILVAGFILAKVFMTSSNSMALSWTITSMILSMIIYYLHERVWNSIGWGKLNQ